MHSCSIGYPLDKIPRERQKERQKERQREQQRERLREQQREWQREQQRERQRERQRDASLSHTVSKNLYRAITPFLVNFFLTRDFVKKSEVCSKFVRTLFEVCSNLFEQTSNKVRWNFSRWNFPGETLKKVRIFSLIFLSAFLKPLKFTKYW